MTGSSSLKCGQKLAHLLIVSNKNTFVPQMLESPQLWLLLGLLGIYLIIYLFTLLMAKLRAVFLN